MKSHDSESLKKYRRTVVFENVFNAKRNKRVSSGETAQSHYRTCSNFN